MERCPREVINIFNQLKAKFSEFLNPFAIISRTYIDLKLAFCLMSMTSFLLLEQKVEREGGITDSAALLLQNFVHCFSGCELTPALSGSVIEMSKPLSQITRAEDAFSGC